MYLYRMNYGFQHLMFFLLFSFTSQNDEKYKKNRYFKFKMLFLIFEFSIFMIIKMHFDFPVSHNQVDHSSPFSKTYFTQCYIILTTFVNLVKKKNCKYYVSMNKSVCENSIPKCIMVSSQKNPEEDDVFMPKNRNIPSRSSTIFHCFFLLAQQCVNTQISSLSKPLSHQRIGVSFEADRIHRELTFNDSSWRTTTARSKIKLVSRRSRACRSLLSLFVRVLYATWKSIASYANRQEA